MRLVTPGTCLIFMKNQTPKKLSELIRIGFQDLKSVQEVAPALLNSLKPSIKKTITLIIEKSMVKYVSDAVEGA